MKPQNVLDDQTPKGSHVIFTYTYFIYSNISHNYLNSFYLVVQVVVKTCGTLILKHTRLLTMSISEQGLCCYFCISMNCCCNNSINFVKYIVTTTRYNPIL